MFFCCFSRCLFPVISMGVTFPPHPPMPPSGLGDRTDGGTEGRWNKNHGMGEIGRQRHKHSLKIHHGVMYPPVN